MTATPTTLPTLVALLDHHAATRGAEVALRERRDGRWIDTSWSAYRTAVHEVAKGLLALGHDVGACVALVGDNRADWVICELAIMAIRGIPAPIYTTLLPDQVAWIVEHAEAEIVICDKQLQLDKLEVATRDGRMPRVAHVVTMDAVPSDDPRVRSLDALRALGRSQDDAALRARLDGIRDDETCLLIYTSGTTGTPKAVQLEHGGMLTVARDLLDCYPVVADTSAYRCVSYLPLCHVAEQVFTTMLHLQTGGVVAFCPDLQQIRDYLVEVRPTVFLGVPRVWEKFQGVLEARFAEATGLRAMLLRWARRVELAAVEADAATGQPSSGIARRLARRLVLGKVTSALGLDQLRIAGTGAAPIAPSTLAFFASIGIVVYEAYGMSETSAVVTTGRLHQPRFGSVGQPLRSVTVRIAEDGEILLKGRGMTRGYLRQPEQTAELIDADGWLHTGDLGAMDPDGWLRITGRKKDILITAGGKNVAPAEMEAHIKSIPGVAQAVVVGDRKPYLAALITLDPEALPELAAKVGAKLPDVASAAAHPGVRAYLDAHVEEACNAKVARYQTIKRIDVLPVDFTLEGGELTPTMKIKRNVVAEKYADRIEALFQDGDA